MGKSIFITYFSSGAWWGAVVARNETLKKKQKMISMPIKPIRMKAKNY
jgi:hypothetical protein